MFAAVLLLTVARSALAEVHYVDVNSTNATPLYTNWAHHRPETVLGFEPINK